MGRFWFNVGVAGLIAATGCAEWAPSRRTAVNRRRVDNPPGRPVPIDEQSRSDRELPPPTPMPSTPNTPTPDPVRPPRPAD